MTIDRPTPAERATISLSARRTMVWLGVTTLVIFLVDGPRISWSDWEVTPQHNINLAEALAWHDGTLHLQGPQREAARVGDKLLNPFPPAFTFFSYAVIGVNRLFTGLIEFPPWAFQWSVGLAVLLITWWAARTTTTHSATAALLSLVFLLGTPMLVMLSLCRIGGFFEVNHILACIGLLLIGGDCLGRRRLWPALIGMALAAWSRQLTLLYFPAILWMSLQPAPRRTRRIIAAVSTLLLILTVFAVMNALKFGSPLDSGYQAIYAGRTDLIAQRARVGLFHPSFIRENLYYMFFEPPGVRISNQGVVRAMNDFGASIWMTSPILLGVVLAARSWWRDRARRGLMLCSFGVLLMLLLYHNTGWRQPGYFRFALDFIPVWLLVIAPWLRGPRVTPLCLVAVIWSVWYFRYITWNNLAWAGFPDS